MTDSIRAVSASGPSAVFGVVLSTIALLIAFAAPAGAELVVFTDGGFLHVEDFERVDGRLRLELDSGGVMSVPLRRIARVIDDEIVRGVPAAEIAAADDAEFPLRWRDQPAPEVPYGELMVQAAERHGLNPELLAAVARAESAFRPEAVSPKGARGLMQLMPATARRFGLEPRDAHDPASALDAGGRYLRWLADRFEDDLPRVLAAYNAGEGTVDRYDGVPPYRETRNYILRIFRHLGLDDEPFESS